MESHNCLHPERTWYLKKEKNFKKNKEKPLIGCGGGVTVIYTHLSENRIFRQIIQNYQHHQLFFFNYHANEMFLKLFNSLDKLLLLAH